MNATRVLFTYVHVHPLLYRSTFYTPDLHVGYLDYEA